MKILFNLLPAETMATMMLVEVEELCTRTVTKTPIMSPMIGLLRILLLANTCTVEQMFAMLFSWNLGLLFV